MTEREAWLHMAEQWRGARELPYASCMRGIWGVRDKFNRPATGLCISLGQLRDVDAISGEVWSRAYKRIECLAGWNTNSIFKWPRTEEGAKQRVAFCEEQARLLEGCE